MPRCDNDCSYTLRLSLDGQTKGTYYFEHSSGYLHWYWFQLRVVYDPNGPTSRACSRSATVVVPPAGGAPAASTVPVIDGLRISAPAAGVSAASTTYPASQVFAADPSPKALLCDQCAVRLRNVELFGDGGNTSGAESATLLVDRSRTLLPPPSGQPDYGVIVERSLIRAGMASRNVALDLVDAPDVVVRDSTLQAVAPPAQATETRLLRTRGTSATSGSTRLHLRGNRFHLEGPSSMRGPCTAVALETWRNIHIWDNRFEIVSDCGAGDAADNTAVLSSGGDVETTQFFAHNIVEGRTGTVHATRGLASSSAGTCPATAWLVRNNYFADLAAGVDDCAGGGVPLLQWNAFSGVELPYRRGPASTSLASLAADPSGFLGSLTESRDNLAAACTFESDGTGSADSPCLDAGSSSASVPVGFTWPAPLFSADSAGTPRPTDLPSVTDRPGSDGTDIGPVEKRP